MTLKEILETLVEDRGPIVLCIVIVMSLVQVSPLKLDPWDALFAWIGRHLNKEVIEKIQSVETRLDTHITEYQEIQLKNRRTNILDFSSSVIRGVNYHKEKFDFMIAECDSYEKYCKDNDIQNGVADASMAEIRRIYQERLRKGDFLSEKINTAQEASDE